MKSGMVAAESAFDLVAKHGDAAKAKGIEPVDYEERIKKSWIWNELYAVRNFRPSFHTRLGVFGGIGYGAVHFLLRGREPFTIPHNSKFDLIEGNSLIDRLV